MEGKSVNEIKTTKNGNKPKLKKDQVLKTKDEDIKSGKNGFEMKNPKPNLNNSVKIEKKENIVNNKVLKRKITEDGAKIEKVLSEGEASSGFETVSSVNSKDDIEDFDWNSSIDRDDFNIMVNIENELAFQNTKEPVERFYYRKDQSNDIVTRKSRSERFLKDHKNRRNDSFKNFRKQKYSQNNRCLDMYYKYDKRDKKSGEREEFSRSRRDTSADRNWSNSGTGCRRRKRKWSGRSRCRSKPRSSKSIRSRSSERSNRSRGSRSPERNIRVRSPGCKGKKAEANRLGNFDTNSANSHPKRNSPPRRRKLHSPSSSVRMRLSDNHSPSGEVNKKLDGDDRTSRNYWSKPCRKKERTPFLVELERKLEAEHLRNITKEIADDSLVPEQETLAINQNSSLLPSSCMPTIPKVQEIIYPFQYPAMPTLSLDNLPLVPGPTGLPVHITMTGEQIPHDMDGRRIPIGPNGHYLPVDPTGRLFPHIVSPGNQAVPIHMTEDGILRLPNSEPVPYGPGHQLPVNIDGSVILIGPDSRSLYLCSNLPRESPLNFFKKFINTEHVICSKQQATPLITQPLQTENQPNLAPEAQQAQKTVQINIQLSKANLSLMEFVRNPSWKINKAELLEKYKKKANERNEDALKSVETEKNFGVNIEGVQRTIPMKLSQKKYFEDDIYSSGSDMILDSNDSESASGIKSRSESHKGATEEIILSSDDEQDILKIVYDSNSHKTGNAKAKQEDPIVEKIQQAIKLLSEKNYQSPAFGRFIITNFRIEPVIEKCPNESPLIKNRIELPFLVPKNIHSKNQPTTVENTAVTFNFLSKINSFGRGDFNCNKTVNKNFSSRKCPVLTFDFAMQCDFTSVIIKNLSSKVSELEKEVAQLKNVNADLLDSYKKVQGVCQKNNDELRKTAWEIQERNNDIQTLKYTVEKRE